MPLENERVNILSFKSTPINNTLTSKESFILQIYEEFMKVKYEIYFVQMSPMVIVNASYYETNINMIYH